MTLYYHVHSAFPYRCKGGSVDREFAEMMLDLYLNFGPPEHGARIVESKDSARDCYYRCRTDTMLIGEIR